jgi:lipopolysaccharide transport protein LptA
MANSFPEGRNRGQHLMLVCVLGLTAITLLTGAAPSGGSGKAAPCTEKGLLESGPAEMDYQTHLLNFRGGVKISRCDVTVAAESAQATGTDFDNSKWVFTGKVHVRTEAQGDLYSDRATVEFVNKVLARATVTGTPAQFEQTQSTSAPPVKGHAGSIDYDVVAGTVKLAGEAWLTRGDSKMDAPSITYNVRDRKLEGGIGTSPDGRVHMTIVPKSDAGSAPSEGKP